MRLKVEALRTKPSEKASSMLWFTATTPLLMLKIHLSVSGGEITIKSPGTPVAPVSLDDCSASKPPCSAGT